jgi:hypothetical protein
MVRLNDNEFRDFVVRLCAIFERKTPSDSVMDIWFSDLQDIPGNLLQDIYNRFKREEYWPRNFPEKVKAIYRILKPQDTWEQPSGCAECDHGLLHVNKGGVSNVYRCQSCQTDTRAGIPMARRHDLLSQGYSLSWTHGTARQIKSMPHYTTGKDYMPGGLKDAAEKIGAMRQDWNEQF